MPYLERSDAASIVAVSSVSGREIDFAAGPYGTMKAALVHYTQGLAYQLAGKGIRANAVSPGNTYFDGGVWQSIEQGNPELFASDGAQPDRPDGHAGGDRPRVTMLASPAASFITGTNLVVDGALTRGVQFCTRKAGRTAASPEPRWVCGCGCGRRVSATSRLRQRPALACRNGRISGPQRLAERQPGGQRRRSR